MLVHIRNYQLGHAMSCGLEVGRQLVPTYDSVILRVYIGVSEMWLTSK